MCRSKLWLVATLIAVGLSTCAACQHSTVRLNKQDAGRQLELKTGDQLHVTLEANPGTGYQWEKVAGDEAILRSLGEPEFEPAGKGLGSGGHVHWRFEAAAPGQTTLQLIYHRSFEPGVPPIDTFQVSVVVR
jgi:inhibitor of cysteine peptidase